MHVQRFGGPPAEKRNLPDVSKGQKVCFHEILVLIRGSSLFINQFAKNYVL
jgi:hypothetical protein